MKLETKIIILLTFILILPTIISAEPSNKPDCMYNPLKGYSWYDNSGPLQWGVDCNNCSAVYKNVGTIQEGWYSSCDDSLIKLTNISDSPEPNKFCNDSDGGKKYYTRGIVEVYKASYIEICVWDDGKPTNGEEGTSVTESWCENESTKGDIEIYKCPYGCKEGACVKVTPQNNTPIKVVENLPKEGCQGCLVNNTCYPFGYRQDKNFCSSIDNSFIAQKEKDSSCENNFECSSNICKESVCKNLSFFKRIANWFKNLF